MFLSLDGTALVQLVNFAIFFVILNVVFLRPVGEAIRKRRNYIRSLTQDYDRYQAQAASLRTQAESVRAAARREAELQLSKARADASNQAADVSTRYAQQATQTIEDAQRTVAGELAAARAGEGSIIADLAEEMLRRALPEAVK